jgi:hypothetical protein
MGPRFQEETQKIRHRHMIEYRYISSKDNAASEEIVEAAELFKKETVT